MDGQQQVLLDTSVLINFARIDRIDLLDSLSGHTFVITDHVRGEVKEHFTEQFDALEAGIAAGTLEERPVNTPQELADFSALMAIGTLGEGECSAIAAAKKQNLPLAIDDKPARNKAKAFHPAIQLLDTVELMVMLIEEQVLTVADADSIKADWEANHRFTLRFASFAEKLA